MALVEYGDTVSGLATLTWLLPTATIVFFAYLVLAIIGGTMLDFPVWLIVVGSLPPLVLTWLALVVAFVDAVRRPRTELPEQVRVVWLVLLAVLNVLALLPYWLFVVRRNGTSSAS